MGAAGDFLRRRQAVPQALRRFEQAEPDPFHPGADRALAGAGFRRGQPRHAGRRLPHVESPNRSGDPRRSRLRDGGPRYHRHPGRAAHAGRGAGPRRRSRRAGLPVHRRRWAPRGQCRRTHDRGAGDPERRRGRYPVADRLHAGGAPSVLGGSGDRAKPRPARGSAPHLPVASGALAPADLRSVAGPRDVDRPATPVRRAKTT